MIEKDEIKAIHYIEHIRHRPGMYIGRLGNGFDANDGLYVLLKEIIDNSVDEFRAGFGDDIIIKFDENRLSVRDFGRGIDFDRFEHFPERLISTDDKNHIANKTIGLSGLGLITVVSLSSDMTITGYKKGLMKRIATSRGKTVAIDEAIPTEERDGVSISFIPDNLIFGNYSIQEKHIINLLKQYSVCNPGLRLKFGDMTFHAPDGMKDLLSGIIGSNDSGNLIYIKNERCDIAIAPTDSEPGIIKSFVNGYPTESGGTDRYELIDALYAALKSRIPFRLLKTDITSRFNMCINLHVENPVFESGNPRRLCSKNLTKDGISIKEHLNQLMTGEIKSFYDTHPEAEKAILQTLSK